MFNALTSPSSDSYTQGTSFVAIENISDPADTMRADFLVGFSAGIDPGESDQNLPGRFSLLARIASSSQIINKLVRLLVWKKAPVYYFSMSKQRWFLARRRRPVSSVSFSQLLLEK